jgi:hypothetical protein
MDKKKALPLPGIKPLLTARSPSLYRLNYRGSQTHSKKVFSEGVNEGYIAKFAYTDTDLFVWSRFTSYLLVFSTAFIS